jgi:hypothetical protein
MPSPAKKTKKDAIAESVAAAKKMSGGMKPITKEAMQRAEEKRAARKSKAAEQPSENRASDRALRDANKKKLGGRRGLIDRLVGY